MNIVMQYLSTMTRVKLFTSKVNNQALQMKLLWKIIRMPDNLWVKLVRNKYLKHDSLFSYKVKANVSWQWRKLMNLRIPFKQGLRWSVGDGHSISFWFDSWAYNVPLSCKCQPCPGTEEVKVSHFLLENGQWNSNLLAQFVPSAIVPVISKMFVPVNPIPDKVFWALTADGEYSIKSGANLLQGYGLHPPSKSPCCWIWGVDVPPKIRFFLWKICQNGLPTKKRLESSHVFLPLECVFCNFHAETDHHLFLDCPFGQDVVESLCDSGVLVSLPYVILLLPLLTI